VRRASQLWGSLSVEKPHTAGSTTRRELRITDKAPSHEERDYSKNDRFGTSGKKLPKGAVRPRRKISSICRKKKQPTGFNKRKRRATPRVH